MMFIYSSSDGKKEALSKKLVVVSPHPTEFMIPLIQEFENETGIAVELKNSGTSDAINEIISDSGTDILWGGSVLSVGPYEDYFYSYETPNRVDFMEEYADFSDKITCFTNVPSVLMINEDVIGDIEINGYEDLLQDELKGQIAFADPSKSSSSFEHLVNMLYAMGDGNPDKGWDYVDALLKNLDGVLLDNSSEVYKGVANGKFKVGLTFEEAAFTMLKAGSHVKIIYMSEGVVSTPDGIYINKNSSRIENAKKFVDFMTSKDAQRYIANNLGRRSVREDVIGASMLIPIYEMLSCDADRQEVIENKQKWLDTFTGLSGEVSDE
ncbi:MAG: extracellular solute-binding protein [Butyrivibrio sp.]|nr:extracellular solute-binding protein [Butyrivibrio sp.]